MFQPLDCQSVSQAMKSEQTLAQQGIEVDHMLEHIENCSECDAKYPPLSENEFEDYMIYVAKKFKQADG